MPAEPVRIVPVGDQAVTVEFAGEISPETNGLVRGLEAFLTETPLSGVLETIPAYRSLLVTYDPLRVSYETLVEALKGLVGWVRPDRLPPSRLVTIPVCYDPELGPDLVSLAERHGLTVDGLIRLHASAEYLVYFIGFTPGLPYLGGLPPELATPRLPTPRTRVP